MRESGEVPPSHGDSPVHQPEERTARTASPVPAPPARKWREVWLRRYLEAADPLMVMLGLSFLLLVVLDYANLPLTDIEQVWVNAANFTIYGLFILDALIRLALTPQHRLWLRDNVLLLIALALPLLLPFAKQLTTPISIIVRLAMLAWGGMHGLAAIRRLSRGQVFYYLALLSTFVVLIGASVVLALEQDAEGSQITSYGTALWWAATLVTTVNSSLDPVTNWGRVVAVLMRIYAVGFFSVLTANMASVFLARFGTGKKGHGA
jgi:voltage-gated potassium channel